MGKIKRIHQAVSQNHHNVLQQNMVLRDIEEELKGVTAWSNYVGVAGLVHAFKNGNVSEHVTWSTHSHIHVILDYGDFLLVF